MKNEEIQIEDFKNEIDERDFDLLGERLFNINNLSHYLKNSDIKQFIIERQRK